jgi:CarD family transcriptional regulator
MRTSARAVARPARRSPTSTASTTPRARRAPTPLARPVTTTRAKKAPESKPVLKAAKPALKLAEKPTLEKLVEKAAEKAPTPSTIPPPSIPQGQRFGSIAPRQVIALADVVAFKVGDKCVHPAHGVGVITAIDSLELGGTKGLFYRLQIIDNGLRLLVPVAAAGSAGLRPIMSAKDADKVLDTLKAREVAVDVQPWSRRFRTYTEMVKSGQAIEIAKVLRDISRLRSDKDLSFGERRLLDQARSLLLKELSLAKNVSEEAMSEKLAKMFAEAVA